MVGDVMLAEDSLLAIQAIPVGGTILIASRAHAATFLVDRRKGRYVKAIDPPPVP